VTALIRLARLRTAADLRSRKTAIAGLESRLLAQLQWSSDEKRSPVRQQPELPERDRSWIRSVDRRRRLDRARGAKDSLKAILSEHLDGQDRPLGIERRRGHGSGVKGARRS